MRGRTHRLAALALVLAGLGLMGSCGGDTVPTGPTFGDLVFAPSLTILPGDDRDTVLVLRNAGPRDLGAIEIGTNQDFKRSPATVPDSFCTGAEVMIVPSSIPSLAEGAEQAIAVTIDLTGATTGLCPAAQYDARLNAALAADGKGLASATVRFDWNGTLP